MNDREVFKKNLNYFLSSSGKMQKDLAEYVGAKTTTVSGWTRGVSYPRADAMEKIAVFFGVPTSRLISSADSEPSYDDHQADPAIRSVADMMEGLPQETKEQIVAIVRAIVLQQQKK